MLEKIKAFLAVDQEVADAHRSTLILTTVVSVVGLGAFAVLEATGIVGRSEDEPTTESE